MKKSNFTRLNKAEIGISSTFGLEEGKEKNIG